MSDQSQPRRPRGRPPIDPHDPSVDFHVSLPSKLYNRAETLARAQGVSMAELFRRAIRRTLPESPDR